MQKIYINVSSLFLCVMFLSTSCQLTRLNHPQKVDDSIGNQIHSLKSFAQDFNVSPGKVSLLYFPYFGPFKREKLVCNSSEIKFGRLKESQFAVAFLAPSYFSQDAQFICKFSFSDTNDSNVPFLSVAIKNIQIKKFEYKKEYIHAEQSKVHLSEKDKKRVEKESELLKKIFSKTSKVIYNGEPFSLPLKSKITSYYGTQRVFNKSFHTQHLGTDLRARIGTEVRAAHSGIVVYAADLFMGGKTIVIDHGLGVFSSYSHLSELKAKVDDVVDTTSIIGLSGMTGRVNGPHLHWGVSINGNWVDGLSLIEESQERLSALVGSIQFSDKQ